MMFLFRLLPKNHINIRIYSPQFPFLITMAVKIGSLYFTQFCEPVFFGVEGFYGRKFLPIGFFFQNTQSSFIKREFRFMLLIKFMLKKIASAARADCEEFLGCRVNLQCWVKVKSDWRDNEFLLNNFGFKQNPSNR